MERIMIGSVALSKTQSGKPVADLYSTDGRLRYPVLRLFDLSALLTVGLDPAALTPEPTITRFWAYYTVSEKTNAQGHPYKDVEYLEAIDAPSSSTSTDTSNLLQELP